MGGIIKRLTGIVLPAVLLSALGCAQQPPVPEDKYYRLPLEVTGEKAATPVLAGTIAVERFRTDGLHNGRALLYAEEGRALELKQYHYHHWVDAPPRLLQEELVSYLRDANAAANVISYRASSVPDYLLTGKIRRFEEIRQASGSTIIVELELEITAGREQRTLMLKDYTGRSEVTGDAVYDIAQAYALAVGAVYGDFLRDLGAMATN